MANKEKEPIANGQGLKPYFETFKRDKQGNIMPSSPAYADYNSTDRAMRGVAPAKSYLPPQTGPVQTPNATTGLESAAAKTFVNTMSTPTANSTAMQQVTDGLMPTRSTQNARGVSNDMIGWNGANGTVVVGGKEFKPTQNIDGVSYFDEATQNKMTNAAYEAMGKELVEATPYVASSGLANAVTWNGGQMMIGGKIVPVAYVSEGKAYADKKLVEQAMKEYQERSGIVGNQQVYDNFNSKYGRRIERALDPILNREKWSYNPTKDPVYDAYREQYLREGNRAAENAAAAAMAASGGYGSSVADIARAQQQNYYNQQLTDKIPELEKQSYNRYLNENELNRLALANLRSVANDDYTKSYTANRDSVADAAAASYNDYLRDISARDFNWERDKYNNQWQYQEPILRNQVSQSDTDTKYYERAALQGLDANDIANRTAEEGYKSAQLQNEALKLSNIIAIAQERGEFTDDEAAYLGLQRNPATGKYPSPYANGIKQMQAQYNASLGIFDY